MIKQYLAFGEFAASAASDGEWTRVKNMHEDEPQVLGYRKFKTREEWLAYLSGIDDAAGWMEIYPLTPEEAKKLSKRMRLSDIDDLANVY